MSHSHYNGCLQGAGQIEEGFRRASYNAKTVRKLIRNLFMDSTGPLAAPSSMYIHPGIMQVHVAGTRSLL